MISRIPESPPQIIPVPETVIRPLWSVMIPTYNCTPFLTETLNSVLAQDPGEELMQIEVIDDFSTDGDVSTLVTRVGKGRIKFFRQNRNVGSLRNFETCLNRSTGQWIHLLHGDDLVKPGFYNEIQMLFRDNPESRAAFTNFSILHGGKTAHYRPLSSQPGVLGDFLSQICVKQLIQPPAIVVKREVYEKLGGFYGVHYGEDWEMWARIASHFSIAYSPKCLASYRFMREGSITAVFHSDGQNVRDIIKVFNIIQTYLPSEQRPQLKNEALKHYSFYMCQSAHIIYAENNEAAFIRIKEAWKMHKSIRSLYFMLKLYFKYAVGYKRTKVF